MKKYEDIVNNLDSSIDFLETETVDILVKVEGGIKIAKSALEEIRDLVSRRKFRLPEDEIDSNILYS